VVRVPVGRERCAKVLAVPATSLLFVCTGNLCRSPSAERFLRRRLAEDGRSDVEVHSAGTLETTGHPPDPLITEAAAFGLDLADHVPHRLVVEAVVEADLVLGMAREHVRDVVLLDRTAFTRSFTLREFVRRAREVGPRPNGVELDDWLPELSGDRRHLHMVGESADDDIPDPMGGPPETYRAMLTEVQALIEELFQQLWTAPETG
jgi:protein-tyrosine phosphatase